MFGLPPLTEESEEDLAAEMSVPRPPPRKAPTRPPGPPPHAPAAPPTPPSPPARAPAAAPPRRPAAPPAAAPAPTYGMRTGPSAKSHATQSFVAASAGSGAGAPAGARRYDPSSMLASGRPGRLGGTSSGRLHPKAKADAAAAGPSRKQMEDRKLQQLRGVFAAFDSDRDSILTKEELANALMSLGINPTPKVIQKYQIGSTSGVIDLATFINVTMTRMQTAESTADQIMVLFKEFDPDGRGFVSAQVMQHLLHELDVSTALTPEESQDLLQMMGVLPKDAPGPFVAGSSVAVDYRQFIDKMIF